MVTCTLRGRLLRWVPHAHTLLIPLLPLLVPPSYMNSNAEFMENYEPVGPSAPNKYRKVGGCG